MMYIERHGRTASLSVKSVFLVCAVLSLLCSVQTGGEQPKNAAVPPRPEDPAFAPVQEDLRLPRVLLIGRFTFRPPPAHFSTAADIESLQHALRLCVTQYSRTNALEVTKSAVRTPTDVALGVPSSRNRSSVHHPLSGRAPDSKVPGARACVQNLTS